MTLLSIDRDLPSSLHGTHFVDPHSSLRPMAAGNNWQWPWLLMMGGLAAAAHLCFAKAYASCRSELPSALWVYEMVCMCSHWVCRLPWSSLPVDLHWCLCYYGIDPFFSVMEKLRKHKVALSTWDSFGKSLSRFPCFDLKHHIIRSKAGYIFNVSTPYLWIILSLFRDLYGSQSMERDMSVSPQTLVNAPHALEQHLNGTGVVVAVIDEDLILPTLL